MSVSFFKAQPEGALNILPLYWHFKPYLVSLSSLPFLVIFVVVVFIVVVIALVVFLLVILVALMVFYLVVVVAVVFVVRTKTTDFLVLPE